MHLKSLTVRGFKSFASATTLEFEPGITCVVGPNGSGKSNVVDAIAWVMGEQGAKSLRGGKMEDVIFAGTTSRPPLGRAEVELVIDNSDGALPIEYTEVRISRILFRSGGSEYSINGDPARLLDIQELLSDSGIGREMHVIVGQGRLDSILHATAVERRGFVEEAAGVLKHRKRKEKALRKLDAMAANLVRLQDLTGELRRQLKPLGRQAEVARRAQVIQADARDARLRILADDYVAVSAALDQEQADEDALLAEQASIETQLQAVRTEQDEVEQQLAQAAPAMRAVSDAQVRLTALQERFSGMIQLSRERIGHLRPDEPEQLSALDPAEIDRQAREAWARQAAAQVEAAALEGALVQCIEVSTAAQAALALAQAATKDAERHRQQWSATVSGLETALAAANTRVEARGHEIERIAAQVETGREGIATLEGELAELCADRPDAIGEVAALAASAAAARAAVISSEGQLDQVRAAERSCGDRAAAANARVETLRVAIVEPTTAKELESAGIDTLGSLPSSVTVVEGYQRAIEAAFASASEAIAVPGWNCARAAATHLTTNASGRTSLLVTRTPTGTPTGTATGPGMSAEPIAGVDHPGDVRPATELLRLAQDGDPAVLAAAREVLASFVIAPNWEVAQRAVTTHPGLRVVTAAGEVLSAGLLVAGPTGTGALQLRQLAAQANVEHHEAVAELAIARDALAAEVARHRQLQHAADAAKRVATQAQVAVDEQTHAERLLATRVESFEQQLVRSDEALRVARRALEDDRQRATSLQTQLADLVAQEPTVEDVSAQVMAALDADLAAARDDEVEARLAARSAADKAASQQARAVELAAVADAERRAIERRRLRARQIERQARAAAGVLGHAEQALALVDAALVANAAERENVGAVHAQGQARLQHARSEAARLAERLGQLADSVHRDEVAKAQQCLRLEQFAEKALNEFGLDAAALLAEYGPSVPVPPAALAAGDDPDPTDPTATAHPFVRSEQERRLRQAEKSMALLGRVNPLALEEFAALEERHTFLTTQLEDLKRSRRDLMQIVSEVDERVRQVFAEAFVDVQREFATVFGRLFPGGEGRLVLTEPDDLLLTGVEVEARPAGKKVKRLSLLSGGERSLTAMAFLVALFKARPAPFYLLDEVEAALDDTNLLRLVGLLAELRESSQLLVITHQKRTMEIADALYGMTMRDGVTQVVSQRLRELQPT